MPIIDPSTGQEAIPGANGQYTIVSPTVTPGGPPAGPGTSTGPLSNRAVKVVGFLVAGAVLVALADVAPEAGVGLTAVLGLGVLLAHANELQQLSNGLSTALGQPATA